MDLNKTFQQLDVSMIPIILVLCVPAVLALRYLYLRRQRADLLKTKGIGRGAEGFQTNVRRIAVPPELAERIRRGETVTAEEITAAQERGRAKGGDQGETSPVKRGAARIPSRKLPANVDQGWLPEQTTRSTSTAARKARPDGTAEPVRRSPRKRA